jgi:cbb3-type cytochrome oxidase maturation protein
MSVIELMVPIALLLGLGFLGAFAWVAASGQYDDLETPAHRILIEDDVQPGPKPGA